jgi:hypothetical protein
MKRLTLYKDLFGFILNNYSGIPKGTDDYDDVQDYLDSDNVTYALSKLLTTGTLYSEIKPLLLTIQENIDNSNIDIDDDVYNRGKIKMFEKHSDKRYSRCLNYFDNSLRIIETSTLYKNRNETYSLECLLFIESIVADKNRQKKLLKELLRKEQKNTYIIEVDKSGLGLMKTEANNFENLYAFALASSMNNKDSIEIPQELVFSWGTNLILASFDYNKNIVYKEFYDIYDVFNDWLHATDILTAFIKMYQIAEYMIYRSQMVEIVNRANIKQSFLRETKNLSAKYVKSERDTIIANFSKLFNSFSLDPREVTASWSFVDQYFGEANGGGHYLDTAKPQNNIDKGVARFIYDTRCAIVHNKESEFHIQYNNYEDYKDIVPLMRSINDIMAKKILEIINSLTPSIHYQSQTLDLY